MQVFSCVPVHVRELPFPSLLQVFVTENGFDKGLIGNAIPTRHHKKSYSTNILQQLNPSYTSNL